MSQGLYLVPGQILKQSFGDPRRAQAYYRAALKAFKKFVYDGKVFYTCNVERLKECDRLGDKKEISLWRTHFFLCSHHFDDAMGVIFSSRPGEELAILSKVHVEFLFLAMSTNEMVNVRNGYRVILTEPLVFASASSLPEKVQTSG